MRIVAIHGEPVQMTMPDRMSADAARAGIVVGGVAQRVGILVSNTNFLAVLPSFYAAWIPAHVLGTLETQIELLIRVLTRYHRSRQSIDESKWGESNVSGNVEFLVELALLIDLLHDNERNGGLKGHGFRAKCPNSENISWPRTFSRNSWVGIGGQLLPAEPISLFREKHRQDEVAIIYSKILAHARALRTVVKREDTNQSFELLGINVPSATRVVRRELAQTFRQRERWVLSTILRILENSTGAALLNAQNRCEYYVVANFERVWEDILRAGVRSHCFNAGMPVGTALVPGKAASNGIRPVPDVMYAVSEDPARIAIVDAKYYRIPEASASDHYKQIVYAQLIRSQGVSVDYNILAFPMICKEDQQVFNPVRYHKWDAIPDSRVIEVAADYMALARSYVGMAAPLSIKSVLANLLPE